MRAEQQPGPLWSRLGAFISSRIGLDFPPERQADLMRALDEAASDFGHTDGEDCAEWLLRADLTPDDLRKLTTYLTIGETYFFRERPSFNAMATEVLPPIIQQRRTAGRRLRLWSAACSTGEEAYSLAILVQQLIPDWRDWNVSILATDINQNSLRRARAAVYGEWSFRDSTPDFRARWFEPVGEKHHRVRAEIREIVTFSELNLASDSFPSLATDTNAIDLILCRNLLMYFTPAHARGLIARLKNCLVDEGWLIVSPSECSQALFPGFHPVNFPGSILYRKGEAPERAAPTPLPMELLHTPAPLTPIEVARVLAEPAPPIDTAPDDVTTIDDNGATAHAAVAHALANEGKLEEALSAGERWVAADKLDAAAHYLCAMVHQELGHRDAARTALNRSVYLLPEFVIAHFSLGNLARAEARHDEARRHFTNAARLLRGHDPQELVPESEGLNVGRLREIITALTAGGDA